MFKSIVKKMINIVPDNMIKSLQENIGFIVIVCLLFVVSQYKVPLEDILSLITWILLLGTIGLLYQLIFPKIPLRIGKILAYTIAIVLFLITLVFISNEKFVKIVIVKLERKITIQETNASLKLENNKVRETNGSK